MLRELREQLLSAAILEIKGKHFLDKSEEEYLAIDEAISKVRDYLSKGWSLYVLQLNPNPWFCNNITFPNAGCSFSVIRVSEDRYTIHCVSYNENIRGGF